MYGKLAMTCFKYQVCSQAITYSNAIMWVVTEPALMSHQTAPTPTTGSPSPSLHGSRTFTHLTENSSRVKLPYLCKKERGKPVWLRNHYR